MRRRGCANVPEFQRHGRQTGPIVREYHGVRASENPLLPNEPDNRGISRRRSR